jgi:O-antigen/teichoic acid export membrane protein
MAMRLTQLPKKYVAPVISRVALPVFARQQDDIPRMRGALLTIQRMLGYVNAPLTLGLLLTAPVIVPLLSGPQWAGAVPLIGWLCVPVLLTGVAGPSQIVRIALGQFRFDFHWSWITGGLLAVGMWIAAGYGLQWVVIVRSILLSIISLVLIGITMRLVATSPRQFASNLKRPALAGLVMSGAVYVAMLLSDHMPIWQRAALCVASGVVVYAAAAFTLDRDFLRSNLGALLGVRAKSGSRQDVPLESLANDKDP